MIKFLIITFLVIYLSIKLAGFVIRMFLRSAGFTINQNGRAAQAQAKGEARGQAGRPTQGAPGRADQTRHVTDNLGDYVDFEEVK